MHPSVRPIAKSFGGETAETKDRSEYPSLFYSSCLPFEEFENPATRDGIEPVAVQQGGIPLLVAIFHIRQKLRPLVRQDSSMQSHLRRRRFGSKILKTQPFIAETGSDSAENCLLFLIELN